MVWAGVTMNQRTRLCIFDRNLKAQRYVDEILRPVVVPFLGRMNQGAIFQDDNARPHHGRVVNEFIRQVNIRRLDWPANSPDLNPIEHTWDELGRRFCRHNLPQTLVQLRQRLIQEWNNIPHETTRRCVQSMRRRCQACLNAHGGHTRYQIFFFTKNLFFQNPYPDPSCICLGVSLNQKLSCSFLKQKLKEKG